jgi:hypothetical protein
MPKRQSSCPEREGQAQGKKAHAKDTRFQVSQSVSDCIEEAIVVFEMQLYHYCGMQAKLDIEFNELAANANRKDLMLIIDLQLQAMDASNQIVTALNTLVRLSHCVG